jgi:hypothetical protein
MKIVKTPPLSFVKIRLCNEIIKRDGELRQKADIGEITHQQYLRSTFPAETMSFIDEAFAKAIEDWNGERDGS